MPDRFRSRASTTQSAGVLVADLLDGVAKRLVDGSREVDGQLLAFAQSIAVLPNGEPGAARMSSHPSLEHMGVPHSHDLLCQNPARAAAKLRRLARQLRLLDAKLAAEQSSPLRLAVRQLRPKRSRALEPMNVPQTFEYLTQWAYDNGVAPAGTPVWAFAFPYPEDCTLHPERRRAESVCRELYELMINSDNSLTRTARVLAQQAFDCAGDLSAIVGHIAKLNADLVELRRSPGLVYFQALSGAGDLSVAKRIAALMNRLLTIAVDLYDLDEDIRLGCIRAPHDHEPRGRRPEPRQWQSVIEDLGRNDFHDDEIGVLVNDGLSEDPAERAAHVTRYLNRHKGNPRGTVFVTGTLVPSETPQASG